MSRTAFCLLAGAALAASSHAAFLSFASDVNFDGPTFRSTGLFSFGDAGTGLNPVNVMLMVDADEDGPNPAIAVPSTMTVRAQFGAYTPVSLGGGRWLHAYSGIGGSVVFTANATGMPVLTISFANAALTSLSNSASLLGSAGGFESDSLADPALSFVGEGVLANVILPGPSSFAFSLSALRGEAGGGRAAVDQPSGSFSDAWVSEGSFSASTIPSPGSVALMGAAMLTAARRRRG